MIRVRSLQDRTVSRLLLLRRRMTAPVLSAFPVALADLLGRALFGLALEAIRFLATAFVLVFPWHITTSSHMMYPLIISKYL